MTARLSYLVCTLLLAFVAVIAPVQVEAKAVERALKVKRDVWDPPITDPTEGTVWIVGDTVQVTWYALLYTHELAYL